MATMPIFDIEKFRIVYPQFTVNVISDVALQWQADLAIETIKNISNFGLLTDIQLERALYALVCHLCTLWQRSLDGQAGVVSSATEGSVSATFSVPDPNDKNFYMQTPCGQAYLSIIKGLLYGGRFYGYKDFHPW